MDLMRCMHACVQARPELMWLGGYLQRFAAGVPGLDWFARPLEPPAGLDLPTAKRSFFW